MEMREQFAEPRCTLRLGDGSVGDWRPACVFDASPLPFVRTGQRCIRETAAAGWQNVEGTSADSTARETTLPSERSRARGERFAIEIQIVSVDHHRTGIHGNGHGRRQGGTPVLELVNRVVVKVVEQF
jgi:hypothetical protein